MKHKKKLSLLALVGVLLFLAPNSKEKIKTLKKELNTTKELEVEKSYKLYKELVEYKDQRKANIENYIKYKDWYAHQSNCLTMALTKANHPKLLDIKEQWYNETTLLIVLIPKSSSEVSLKFICKVKEGKEYLESYHTPNTQ